MLRGNRAFTLDGKVVILEFEIFHKGVSFSIQSTFWKLLHFQNVARIGCVT
jgi:hypothetical protein